MTVKEEFIDIFTNKVHRAGAKELLDYMENQTDFFTAPASARYHSSFEGGLCEHSLNVYDCLCDLIDRPRVQEVYELNYTDESLAIVALLHDLCKAGCYKTSTRNVKQPDGSWRQQVVYQFEDPLPFGHGEKSVYLINRYMKLTHEEAFAIRYHMGFSGVEDNRDVGKAFEMFPLAYFLHAADSEATYFLEGKED